ncbi:hypothetical protein FHG87_016654 [Trinorchestia longiramus]|nr:hypothetical protein FHG87_016654 [Trinorchestia longiramus]
MWENLALALKFPNIVIEEEYEILNTEWQELTLEDTNHITDKEPEKFWYTVSKESAHCSHSEPSAHCFHLIVALLNPILDHIPDHIPDLTADHILDPIFDHILDHYF